MIFGWDMNQNGNDGLLSETVFEQNGSFLNAIETFDEPSGTITAVVQKDVQTSAAPEPVVEAISGDDIGFIDIQQYIYKNYRIIRTDQFEVMNPVSGNKITGSSMPPRMRGDVPNFVTNNQQSANQAMLAYRYGASGGSKAFLWLYDVTKNTWQNRYVFPHDQVLAGYVLYAAVDTKRNALVTSYQTYSSSFNPYEAPSFDVFDAKNGKLLRTFQGLGMGFLAGMAIDSTTGIMCTTTQNDMEVEFYEVASGKGFAVTIPGNGGALTGGAAVAVDPVNHLFFIAQLNSTFSGSGGSTVIVYDEMGNIVEAINGFNFLNNASPVVVHVAVNAGERLGYVNGPNPGALQSFTY